ncbi:MAG: hypothetical protein D9V44_10530 [Actinobacteria bacterium]|nr:MAG: hypothetical protein D9V44_10530 [Actinomycetota bacterium]
MHLALKNMTGASAHRVAATVAVTLVVLVIASLLGATPAFHQALGIGSTDALDEGVLMPKMSKASTNLAPVFGLFALAFLVAASTVRVKYGAPAVAAVSAGFAHRQAIATPRRRAYHTAHPDDDADHRHTPIAITSALRSAPYSAQPEGLFVSVLCSALHHEEGSSAR